LPSRSDIDRPRGDPRRLFRLQLTLGAGGLLAAAAAVAVAAASVRQAPNGAGHLVIAGLRFTYPTLNIAAAILLALAVLGVVVLSIALRSSWRQRRSYRSFLRQIDVLGSLHGNPTVTVIEGSTPQAFCAGYLRPAVYVSRGTVELLSAEELHAVLAHEHHHLQARDPLRFAVARILSQALFFLPVLRALGNRYGELAEMTADDAAVRSSRGQAGPLASALLAFHGGGPPHAAGISNDRVDSLLGRPPRWRPLSAPMAMSLLALSTFAMLIWRASEIASASATFNLPILSARPCLAFIAVILLFAFTRMVERRRGVVGRSPRARLAS
jgi:hypothetical protein